MITHWASAATPGCLLEGDGASAFYEAGTKFIAVRFKIGTAVHYGWINVDYSFSAFTILSYAYESSAGTSIATPASAPVADFAAGSLTADSKTTVNMYDLSLNYPTSWEWTFTPATIIYMGGTGPTSKDPQVKFTADGKYTVKLKVTSINGSDSISRTDYISVLSAPTVDFTASIVSTDTKTPVTFTEACTNMPTSWEWSFTPATITYMAGTGATSKNPQVKFNVAGKYSVKLKASNAVGTDSTIKTSYVTVIDTTTPPETSISGYQGGNDKVIFYPNPASKVFIVECPGNKGTITILDLNGRVEFSQQITSKKMELNVGELPKGHHILRISDSNGVSNTKLLLE